MFLDRPEDLGPWSIPRLPEQSVTARQTHRAFGRRNPHRISPQVISKQTFAGPVGRARRDLSNSESRVGACRWVCLPECRYGLIYPQGGEILQAFTDRSRIAAKLQALACVLSVRGSAETVVTFHVDHIQEVFAVLKPCRRRQVSEGERVRLREMGTAALVRYRANRNVGSDLTALESTRRGRVRGSVSDQSLRPSSGAEPEGVGVPLP